MNNLKQRKEKIYDINEAMNLITDGMRIAFGGFVLYQKPMAAIHELIRLKRKNLTVVGPANSIDVDMLVGSGSLSQVETSYVGLEKFGLARNYRRAMESGNLKTIFYPELIAWDRFRASREGLAFWPVNSLGGSDIANQNPEIKSFSCPITGNKLWAVPAANLDVGIIHAPAADKYGNVQIQEKHMLPQGFNVALARACKTLIVTVEKIIDNDEILENPQLTIIPSFKTTCVVHVPNGSHPTPTLYHTKMDEKFLEDYTKTTTNDKDFKEFLNTYIYDTNNFANYLNVIGNNQIDSLRERVIK